MNTNCFKIFIFFAVAFLTCVSSVILSQQDVQEICKKVRLGEIAGNNSDRVENSALKHLRSNGLHRFAENVDLDEVMLKSLAREFSMISRSGSYDSYYGQVKIYADLEAKKAASILVTNAVATDNGTVIYTSNVINEAQTRLYSKKSNVTLVNINGEVAASAGSRKGRTDIRRVHRGDIREKNYPVDSGLGFKSYGKKPPPPADSNEKNKQGPSFEDAVEKRLAPGETDAETASSAPSKSPTEKAAASRCDYIRLSEAMDSTDPSKWWANIRAIRRQISGA